MIAEKKVLIVAHYFPPMNSTGARRPEALASFLVRNGMSVVVLTTKKGSHARKYNSAQKVKVIECSLLSTSVFESIGETNVIPESRGVVYSSLQRFKHKVVNRYLGQIFDPRLPFAFYLALKVALNRISYGKLFKWVNDFADADILVSTSPPWTSHLLGLLIAKILKIPFVVDYRDQFSLNHMFSQNLSRFETKLDRLFCTRSSLVSVVSDPMKEYYESLSNSKVLTVMNGYDERYFSGIKSEIRLNRALENDKITVRYFGTITADRLMEPLWSALLNSKLCDLYRFEFYGDSSLLQNYLSEFDVEKSLDVLFFKSVPHKEALKLMSASDALLFTETSEVKHASQRGVLTTKLFEYLASCRPLIAIIDENTVAGKLISQSGLGISLCIDEATIGLNLGAFPKIQSINPNVEFISKFSRCNQFSILLKELDAI